MMNAMIGSANSAGERWAAWIIVASLDAGLLLASIGLAWSVIRKRVAPQVGYCLFLLVPVKLLIPVIVTVPAPMAQWTPSAFLWSRFEDAPLPDQIETGAAVETPIAAARPDQPPRSESKIVPLPPTSPEVAISHPPRLPAELRSPTETVAAREASTRSEPERRRLSMSAIVMMAWLVGVVLLLARLARTQLRFRAHLRHASPLDLSRHGIDLGEMCRRAGVAQSIRIVEQDSIAAPAVWGIARPTIILPRGIASTLSAQQLRWVLFHELAHIRRRDLLVVALQRFATMLHFFNPAIWIANRVIHRLREYVCDDHAVSMSQASAVESGEAFLRILRCATRSPRDLRGALGVFGLDSRASCFLRVGRLLDTERPIRTAPGAWSLCGLILFAAVSLPHLRAESGVTRADPQGPANPSQADPQKGAGEPPDRVGREFELRVLRPDGKPIPEALVKLNSTPNLTANQIRRGKLVKPGSYGVNVSTDAQGQIAVELPQSPSHFNVYITIPGYGPYWAGWSSESHAEPIPSRFTAELEAAWSVGGIIVDPEGKPVEGVTVRPSIEFKKRPGVRKQLGVGTDLKSDAAGRWRFDSVPVSMSEVFADLDHPSFRPVRRSWTRRSFGIERGQDPTGKIVLDRGLSVIGKVTDEAGRPIVGARVRTKFLNDIREARTGDDGAYRLAGCEPRPTRIVVSAKGRATDMKELNIDSDMGPVDFRMKPGGTVRLRVLDEQGKPIPKARIFFQDWRGRFSYFEFDHVDQYADNNGAWVWNEAPLDEFKADICPPGGMQLDRQTLIAREQEYVFRPPTALVVTGKVIDAATRKPIEAFRVVPGSRDNQARMFWNPRESFLAGGGHYEIRQTRGDFAHLIRIEADGYQAAVSRDIKSNEGALAIDFELKRGNNVAAKVVTPQNVPAAGAKVALGVAGAQICIKNGDIDEVQTYCAREITGETGRFHFPAQSTDFQLVITHPSGFAHIKSTPEWELTRIIRLEPWSRVEGTFRVGPTPAPHVPLRLQVAGHDTYGNGLPHIFTQYESSTGPEGRFVFERVFPGNGWIGRSITLTVDEGATEVTSSCTIAVECPAGKTVSIDLGGTGRAVVGKLQPPEGFGGKARWNFAMVTAVSDENEALPSSPYLRATVDRDGRFRIDDVPAGNYTLNVRFDRDPAGQLPNHRFKVSPTEGESPRPVDLGVLTLEKR